MSKNYKALWLAIGGYSITLLATCGIVGFKSDNARAIMELIILIVMPVTWFNIKRLWLYSLPAPTNDTESMGGETDESL